ncbi:MAG: hypothetical protein LQ342_004943 [Letrouitia transgressa]|nr:MAG: hypothetical protein LQ342_004943 [Letrouitia transgressa]
MLFYVSLWLDIQADISQYIAKLKSQGLLSIDHLGSFENAVALCGTCRDNFINLYEPAFIFLPSDLQFFLRWEKEDFRFRINDYRNFGTCRARRPPTAADYNKWLSQKLQHDSETELSQNGGLYSLYTLHEYLPRMPGISATRVGLSPFHKSKRWHGDPMASLRRAFLSLGSRAHVYPRLVRRQLQRLQDMYIENTEQRIKRRAQGTDKITDRSSDSGPDLEAVQNLTHIQPEAKKLEHETPGEQSKNLGCPVKSQAPEKNVSRALSKRKRTSPDSKEASAKRRKPGMEPQQKPHWTWGPEATSNRAMELFRKRYMARKAKREKKAKEKAVEYKAESRRPEGLVTPRSLPKPEKSDFGRT